METVHEICSRYEAELARIATLDRVYYLNPCPSRAERTNYAIRQSELEALRYQLYAELAALREIRASRRCGSFIRRRSRNHHL
jgi:hypothetical protein